jgi:hypothetical protein
MLQLRKCNLRNTLRAFDQSIAQISIVSKRFVTYKLVESRFYDQKLVALNASGFLFIVTVPSVCFAIAPTISELKAPT